MLITLRCSVSANIQPDTIRAKITAVIHSSRDNGPSSASSFRAASGASGVSRMRGGKSRATTQGSARIAVSAGTEATSSHLPKPISSPKSRTICRPIGLAEVAVIQSADETARLAMPQNIR